jgi:hypothetical protein
VPAAPARAAPGSGLGAAPAARAAPTAPALRAAAPGTPAARPPAASPRPATSAAPAAAGQAARPAPGIPAALPRPGGRSAPAPGNGAAVPAAPVVSVASPVSAAPAAPAQRPRPVELDLELPSLDALSEARARRAEAPAASPPALADDPEEELTPLPDDAHAPGHAGPPTRGTGDQAILDAIDRLAGGGHAELELLKPTQAIAVLIRLLIRKGLIGERELLEGLRQGREPE